MEYGPAALQDVLKGVTFSVEPRMKVAVVGFLAARGKLITDVRKQLSHRFEAPPAAENPACCSLAKGVHRGIVPPGLAAIVAPSAQFATM